MRIRPTLPCPKAVGRALPAALAALWLAVAGVAPGRPPPAMGATEAPVTVAAAASLQGVMRDVSRAYAAAGGTPPTLVFGASGSLARQIRSGAPYDVFASADARWIDTLAKGGHIVPGTERTYALGQLALVAHRAELLQGLPKVLGAAELARLRAPQVRVLALANPATAPYGAAAKAALERAGLWDALHDRVVYGENVRQALTFVDTGNADAALTATALVLGTRRHWRSVATELHPPIRQTVALVARSKRQAAARRFVAFLVSPQAAAILERHGLKPTGPGGSGSAAP